MLGTSFGTGSLGTGSVATLPRPNGGTYRSGGSGSGYTPPDPHAYDSITNPQPGQPINYNSKPTAPSPPITSTPPYGINPGNPMNPAIQPSQNPSAAAQWLNAQMGLTAAQTAQANADLAALYNAQAAAAGGGGGGSGPPPNWQLMKDKLLAALKNVQADVKSGQALAGASERATKNKYGADVFVATSDATGRGAITSRGYGQNLTNAATSRDHSLAEIRRQRDQLALSLLSGTQAYNFGLADIKDQQSRWGRGGGGGGSSGALGVLMAQLNQGTNANNMAAINAQAGYIQQAVASGLIKPEAGAQMLANLLNPPKPHVSKPKPVGVI